MQAETSHEMATERSCGPDSELSAALGVDAITDRQHGVEIEIVDLIRLSVAGSHGLTPFLLGDSLRHRLDASVPFQLEANYQL